MAGGDRAATSARITDVSLFRGGPERRGVYETGGVERLGGLVWKFGTAGTVRSSPALANGRLYIGSGDGNLYALDAASGTEVWRAETGSPVLSVPAVAAGRVFFANRANEIHALDAAIGESLWVVETGDDVPFPWGEEDWDYFVSSPLVSGDTVYVGSGDGNVYALDAASGAERWRFAAGGPVRSSPALGDGVVYVGSADGHVYGIDAATGQERWRFATEGVGHDSAAFGYDRKTVQASPAVVDGVVYFGARDGGMYAVRIDGARQLWRFSEGPSWVVMSAAVADGVVYNGRSDTHNFRAIDAASGEQLWEYGTGGLVWCTRRLRSSATWCTSAAAATACSPSTVAAASWCGSTASGTR